MPYGQSAGCARPRFTQSLLARGKPPKRCCRGRRAELRLRRHAVQATLGEQRRGITPSPPFPRALLKSAGLTGPSCLAMLRPHPQLPLALAKLALPARAARHLVASVTRAVASRLAPRARRPSCGVRRGWPAGVGGAAERLVGAGVVLLEHLLRDALEQLLREGAQQRPGEVERLEDGAVLVRALVDELGLELVEELEVEVVLRRERLIGSGAAHTRAQRSRRGG